MVIKTKLEHNNNWLVDVNVPEVYRPDYRFSQKEVNYKNDGNEVFTRQLVTDGLFVMYANLKLSRPLMMETIVDGETITSQFVFYRKHDDTTKAEAETKSTYPNILYGRSRHNLHYIPATHKSFTLNEDIEYSYFLVVVSKEYYFNLVNRQSLLHEDFASKMAKGEYSSYAKVDLQVTFEMRAVIENMLNCSYQDEMKRIHTEAHILELLMYQLEQLKTNENKVGDILGDTADLDKLQYARQILEQQFTNPPTQKELSRMSCLNEFKLRRGFKEYFGSTIHDYVTRLKMEYARILLTKEKKSVYDVSLCVGFAHQNNFSAAFKKYYGISPTAVA